MAGEAVSDEIERSKQALRKKLLGKVRGLGGQRSELDRALCTRLEDLPEVERARTILAFAPLPSEPRIDPVIDRWNESTRSVLLPKIGSQPGAMTAVALGTGLTELKCDALGVRTPQGASWNRAIDLILVPGCGFDLEGGRLGRGGGYYDRFLAGQVGVLKVGLCFECQMIDRLPTEAHDQSVDLIVTESRVIDC